MSFGSTETILNEASIDNGDGTRTLRTNTSVTGQVVVSGGSTEATLASVLSTLAAGIIAAAGEHHVGEVGGNLVTTSTQFTRPGDTTPYGANDVVSDSTSASTFQVLTNAARVSAGTGYITGIRLVTDKKSITPRFRVHFWNNTGATIAADNAQWTDLYADSSLRIGYWDLPAMSTGAGTSGSDNSRALDLNLRVPYNCAVTSLYYVLETLDAFTPASGQKFTLTLFCDRN